MLSVKSTGVCCPSLRVLPPQLLPPCTFEKWSAITLLVVGVLAAAFGAGYCIPGLIANAASPLAIALAGAAVLGIALTLIGLYKINQFQQEIQAKSPHENEAHQKSARQEKRGAGAMPATDPLGSKRVELGASNEVAPIDQANGAKAASDAEQIERPRFLKDWLLLWSTDAETYWISKVNEATETPTPEAWAEALVAMQLHESIMDAYSRLDTQQSDEETIQESSIQPENSLYEALTQNLEIAKANLNGRGITKDSIEQCIEQTGNWAKEALEVSQDKNEDVEIRRAASDAAAFANLQTFRILTRMSRLEAIKDYREDESPRAKTFTLAASSPHVDDEIEEELVQLGKPKRKESTSELPLLEREANAPLSPEQQVADTVQRAAQVVEAELERVKASLSAIERRKKSLQLGDAAITTRSASVGIGIAFEGSAPPTHPTLSAMRSASACLGATSREPVYSDSTLPPLSIPSQPSLRFSGEGVPLVFVNNGQAT